MNANTLPLASLTLKPLSLPSGGRFRKEIRASRWMIRFQEFMGTIHKETEESGKTFEQVFDK